ncbi:hypothetical protein ABZV93_00580 [Actinopolymorpha sp. NPDC004070]|uniref:hypothetical protein n=1 Tax=Actinopolymorpha sp. NPDC004070 TaxID=3154548 RepID=UPI0033AC23E0
MAALMLVAIFGIRPLFSDRLPTGFYGYDVSAGQDLALTVGMTCLVSLGLGVFLASGGNRSRPGERPRPVGAQPMTLGRLAVASAGGVVVYAVFMAARYGPSVFGELMAGRSASLSETLGGIPEVVTTLPLSGSVAAALYLISHRSQKMSSAEWWAVTLAALVSVIGVSALGNRRFLIPAVLAPVIAALVRRPVRLHLWHLAVGLAMVVVLAAIPMVRSAGARAPGQSFVDALLQYIQQEGIVGTLVPVFASYDTEMFDYIALAGPSLQSGFDPWGAGRGTLLAFVTWPMPSAWFQSYRDEVLTRFWGGGCGNPVCPVSSLAGVLYFDGGLIVVAIGSVLAGLLLRRLTLVLANAVEASTLKLLMTVIASSFALVAVRTDTVAAIWWCFYMCGIGLVSYALLPRNAQPVTTPRLQHDKSLRQR